MRKDRVVLSEFYQDHRVLFFCTLLFGLLYIHAFMYGFFWLWIAPFTGVAILFLRAMIDDAIARVAQKGDAAVQAKAMIPEFIKMNIVAAICFCIVPEPCRIYSGHSAKRNRSGVMAVLFVDLA